jgi:hypothetical protein
VFELLLGVEVMERKRWLEFVDAAIIPEFHALETMRYINITLLCVQKDATDRPTTQYLVAMLGNEETSLPEPKHLAFFDVKVTDEEP